MIHGLFSSARYTWVHACNRAIYEHICCKSVLFADWHCSSTNQHARLHLFMKIAILMSCTWIIALINTRRFRANVNSIMQSTSRSSPFIPQTMAQARAVIVHFRPANPRTHANICYVTFSQYLVRLTTLLPLEHSNFLVWQSFLLYREISSTNYFILSEKNTCVLYFQAWKHENPLKIGLKTTIFWILAECVAIFKTEQFENKKKLCK